MSLFWGWLPVDAGGDAGTVVASMGRALSGDAGHSSVGWSLPGLAVGLSELGASEAAPDLDGPAATLDGRYRLWMVGEAFAGGGLIDVPDADCTRSLAFRRALLARLLERGVQGIVELDGEYLIGLWDARDRVLTLLNDRFGALPLYWARSAEGFAFASGVRGVLMAPGVPADPDAEAILEAVTFGGFRLGARTNVAAVKMVPGASIVSVRDASPTFRRYWRWADAPPEPGRALPELIEQAHQLWREAIRARLGGSARPGQTLSGGLDSRAILAEAAPRAPGWTAITYGVPGCDDARYAERAAVAMGTRWVFYPLYSGRAPGWLDRRSSYIQETDGLIQLVDLMHLEALPLQKRLLDLHLCGYGGDAICGSSYDDVRDPESFLAAMPFYGTRLGWSHERALGWAREAIGQVDGGRLRFAAIDCKYPQSIQKSYQAPALHLRVRKPFTAYAVSDFFGGLDDSARRQRLYERMLRTFYPACFAAIPNQRTGLPVLAPRWRVRIERARRFAGRTVQPGLSRLGLRIRPRIRHYHADDIFWRTPEARARIEGAILRPASLACEILGREAVTQVVSDWFDRLAAPTQVIGALYVYEAYHRDLPAHLRMARHP
jgi:hypothetical protein